MSETFVTNEIRGKILHCALKCLSFCSFWEYVSPTMHKNTKPASILQSVMRLEVR